MASTSQVTAQGARQIYNRDITHAPVTLFLGAGASKPLGKMLMGEFIYDLYRDDKFARHPLFKGIVSKNQDLEYLFEELEDWAGKQYLHDDNLGNMGNIQFPGSIGTLKDVPGYAQQLLVALREKVFDAYKEIEDKDRVNVVKFFNQLLDGIFSTLGEKQYPLVIFTTNYDPVVETYCDECKSSYALADGFAVEGGPQVWRRENFDNFHMQAPKKNIALFKLHGSATWVRKDGRVLKLPFPIYADQGRDFENILIYPARKKVALDNPFLTGYDYFQRTMDACGCCIVIGYSFRDYDALTKLASASIFNPRLRLLVVDPQAETLCRMLSDKGIRCTAARQKFGENIEYMHEVAEHIVEALKSSAPSYSTTNA